MQRHHFALKFRKVNIIHAASVVKYPVYITCFINVICEPALNQIVAIDMLTLADDFRLFVIVTVARNYRETVVVLSYRDSVNV